LTSRHYQQLQARDFSGQQKVVVAVFALAGAGAVLVGMAAPFEVAARIVEAEASFAEMVAVIGGVELTVFGVTVPFFADSFAPVGSIVVPLAEVEAAVGAVPRAAASETDPVDPLFAADLGFPGVDWLLSSAGAVLRTADEYILRLDDT